MQSDCCTFCLDSLQSGGDARHRRLVLLQCCQHYFHRACLLKARNDCCPLCRTPISASKACLNVRQLDVIRKRKRDDVEDANREAAEDALCAEYIGPGTERHAAALEALMQVVPSKGDMCTIPPSRLRKLGHRHLHKGVLRDCGVSCEAVRDFITNTQMALGSGGTGVTSSGALDSTLLALIEQHLPRLPPGMVRELVRNAYPDLECAALDDYLRAAWRRLVSIDAPSEAPPEAAPKTGD